MYLNNKISIIGGDLRLVNLAEMLVKDGKEIYNYGMENIEKNNTGVKCRSLSEAVSKSNIIVAPIPLTSDGITINSPFSNQKILLKNLLNECEGKTFITGAVKQEIYKLSEGKNIEIIDMLKREELAVLNAISTAEGAIKIIIEETLKTIHRSNILILGFGRIGKVLANHLKGMGANVSCEARKNADLAWIKAYGYKPIPLEKLNDNLSNYDVIVNTIPYMVLDKNNLNKVDKNTLIIDLASNPGGVDREEVKKQNIKFVWALSLPGKVAPVTSAEYIKETIDNVLKEL